ncbi:MAG: ABC transporter permease [Chloroflexota bacterium]|nr:ABC transporter permease [Chloroflexota bacterium]
MNRAYFTHVWRANRWRLAIVAIALAAWGALLPIVFDAFGAQFQALIDSGIIPSQFARFGGGDIFSLAGSVALGFVHPIAVGLALVFSVGFAAAAIAGERERGTLEVLLARPVSRRRVYATALAASMLFAAVTMGALTLGALAGSAVVGRLAELGPANLPVVWLNATLLFCAFGAISLGASVSFDRLTPAIGTSLAIVLVSYFLDVIAELWPAAAFLQPYSLFHYLDARAGLSGFANPGDMVVLIGVTGVAIAYALVVFPQRDLAAPA